MISKLFFRTVLLLLASWPTVLQAQYIEMGVPLYGDAAGDYYGTSVCLSADGTTMAVGAIFNDDAFADAGHVQVYSFNGTAWVAKGVALEGEGASNQFGHATALSADGNILAVGGKNNSQAGTDAGHVRVFEWNGSSWVQLGIDLDGEAGGDEFGYAVDLSADGTILAAGGPGNDGNGSMAGHTRVYQYNGSSWVQMGTDIDGESASSSSGWSVSLSGDGLTVAIGATFDDAAGNNAGQVRIFEYTGSAWVQKGTDLDGANANDYFGHTVSLSNDGNSFVVGAWGHDAGGTTAGQAQVYEYTGSSWVQKGTNIDGGAGDYFGQSCAMDSTGNTIVVGGINNDGLGSDHGYARVFTYSGGAWSQIGNYLNGDANDDYFGFSSAISYDAAVIAIGASENDVAGMEAGQVKTFEACAPVVSLLNHTACDTYTWPQTGQTYVATGTYYDTLALGAANGCDSVVGLQLIINPSPTVAAYGATTLCLGDTATLTASGATTYSWSPGTLSGDSISVAPTTTTTYVVTGDSLGCTDTASVTIAVDTPATSIWTITSCGPYTWLDSVTYLSSNNSATFVLPAAAANGCDSIVALDLTILQSSANTISDTTCSSYSSPSGNYIWTMSGTYMDTIPNSVGCDSVLTINLTIDTASTSIVNASAFNSYLSPGGTAIWTSSGTYIDTLINDAGCDSIVTVNLSIQSTSAVVAVTACDSLLSPSGNYVWVVSGTYHDTIPNSAGCDSLITVQATIASPTSAIISASTCTSYSSPSGNYSWAVSGTYLDTIPNNAGCDSIITINLTVGSASSTIAATSCNNYVSPSGSYVWTTSGTYVDTIQTTASCDSIITVNLVIGGSSVTIPQTVCDSMTAPSGNYVWTTSGTYTDTIADAVGCDSIITFDLIVLHSAFGIDTRTECSPYTWIDGNVYTGSSDSTSYTITGGAANGCDSVVLLDLTINTVDTSTSVLDGTITSNAVGASYEWLDCDNSFMVIPGANEQAFTPVASGNYAVEVTQNGCTDTSACTPITVIGIEKHWGGPAVTVFPIPAGDQLFVSFQHSKQAVTIRFFDLSGSVIATHRFNAQPAKEIPLEMVPGMYLMEIWFDDGERTIVPVVKE